MSNVVNPEYQAAALEWGQARDCMGGEVAVKSRGRRYLPALTDQTEEEYATYLQRASFRPAAAAALQDCMAAIFRRVPEVRWPEGSGSAADWVRDVDGCGTTFLDHARQLTQEVLTVGRAGTLVEWAEATARVSLWTAEQILDWEYAPEGGELVRVVLRVTEAEQLVLRLEEGRCIRELHKAGSVQRGAVLRAGAPVSAIPLIIHGPSRSRAVQRAPLADVVLCNLDHYRLMADYRHGLHLAALPTAWVAGFDTQTALKIGSAQAWVAGQTDASAGFLEVKGNGLAHMESALERSEALLKELGARLIGRGEAGPIEPGLAGCVASISATLADLVALATGTRPTIQFSDLAAIPIRGPELTALIDAWRIGGISRETLLDALKRGELLPAGRTVQEERRLIHGTTRSA